MDRIKREIRKALQHQGLDGLEYCYVVETRSRWAKSRTQMHLHGFFPTREPLVATRFKVAMESAIAAHPAGRAAAGIAPKSGEAVLIEPAYEVQDKSVHGKGRWAGYIAKNATKWDARFRRRLFMSQSATQTAREFWALIRKEPLD